MHMQEAATQKLGNSLIIFGLVGERIWSGFTENAMVWIALCGLFLSLFTSLPAIASSFRTINGWFKK